MGKEKSSRMKNRVIVIEGTDCSGKETQSKLLKKNLEKMGRKVFYMAFPNYNSPTGKIIGGPYLGKEEITNGWFPETAPKVDPKVSSLLFALDRLYNQPHILQKKAEGYDIIIDRYTYSAMAHQGGKIKDKETRFQMYQWIEKLEFETLNLLEPDLRIFLHMPFEAETILRNHRISENLDENEKDPEHLMAAEQAYFEIAEKYQFKTIECTKSPNITGIEDIKSKEEIAQNIWEYIQKKL